MTSLLPRTRTLFPGLIDWLDNPWPFGEHNLMRIEERTEDGKYLVRAELPGFDPHEHIHVKADGGLLTITAERESRLSDTTHSEFRYGSFSRTVTLPEGADTANITAKYTNGILEVTVPVEPRQQGKTVEIAVTKT